MRHEIHFTLSIAGKSKLAIKQNRGPELDVPRNMGSPKAD